ncbi:cytochrome c [Alphaproteobacteria bacterium]|jgi:mono/diheme cytochrome c family protein|nr:cytochrome c [Alphaproteobacteria bacterium]
MNNWIKASILAVVLVAIGVWYAVPESFEPEESGTAEKSSPINSGGPSLASIEQGESLYAENCASCHGANLEGQSPDWKRPGPDGVFPAPPHDRSGHTWHHDDQVLFDYTKLGGANLMKQNGIEDFNSGMPGFEETLSDGEIWAVLNFIKSTWPSHIQEQQRQRTTVVRNEG